MKNFDKTVKDAEALKKAWKKMYFYRMWGSTSDSSIWSSLIKCGAGRLAGGGEGHDTKNCPYIRDATP